MNSALIAMRYAHAVYEFDSSEELFNEFGALEVQFKALSMLQKSLANSKIGVDKKEQFLLTAVDNPSHSYRRLIAVVLKNGRAELMRQIGLNFCSLYNKEHKIKEVEVVVAHRVDEQQRDKIASLLAQEGYLLKVNVEVDPSVIGGFRVSDGVKEIDATVTNELKQVKKLLSNVR